MKKKFKLITYEGERFTVEAEKIDQKEFGDQTARWKRLRPILKQVPGMADAIKRTDDAFAKGVNPIPKDAVGYKVCCPLHGEKTPSLMVRADLGLWHCFGCGKGGKILEVIGE